MQKVARLLNLAVEEGLLLLEEAIENRESGVLCGEHGLRRLGRDLAGHGQLGEVFYLHFWSSLFLLVLWAGKSGILKLMRMEWIIVERLLRVITDGEETSLDTSVGIRLAFQEWPTFPEYHPRGTPWEIMAASHSHRQ